MRLFVIAARSPSTSHIAHAIADAELTTIKDCGHFTYLECGDGVRRRVDEFFRRTN